MSTMYLACRSCGPEPVLSTYEVGQHWSDVEAIRAVWAAQGSDYFPSWTLAIREFREEHRDHDVFIRTEHGQDVPLAGPDGPVKLDLADLVMARLASKFGWDNGGTQAAELREVLSELGHDEDDQGCIPSVDGVKLTYDPEVDAAYLYFVPSIGSGEVAKTVVSDLELDRSAVVFDLDSAGRIVGVELLGASRALASLVVNPVVDELGGAMIKSALGGVIVLFSWVFFATSLLVVVTWMVPGVDPAWGDALTAAGLGIAGLIGVSSAAYVALFLRAVRRGSDYPDKAPDGRA